ncbi:MAG TPA: YoaK family protein [Sphingomicrobium sp.]|nr:YoaK family protein [Sphingomicrobium sp.]
MINVPAILLAMTAVSGVVDAVSFIALGHVFTANMTGNIVFLGFAIGGVAGLSIWRSLLALAFFMSGAVLGGCMTRTMKPQDPGSTPVHALAVETILLWVASAVSIGFRAPYEDNKLKLALVIALTAVVMGLRNAVVRKLVPDLTTTVLTLTIAGFAADSSLAGGDNPRWGRRAAAVLAMLAGAIAGTSMLAYSVAVPLFVCGVMTAICALARLHLSRKELSNG